MAISLNLHDLQFILKQIKIAEAHSNGAALTEIRINPATGEVITDPLLYGSNGQFLGDASWGRAIPDPKTPFGLRTVDGSYNNLVEGREYWGAADQLMPRYFDQSYRDGGPETPIDVNGPAPGGIVTNTNYGSPGDVVDTDPRVISNLVVDMSANNPAALWAALKFAESADPYADLAQLLALRISPQAALDQQAAAAQLVADKDVALDAAVLAYASAANPSPAQRIQLIDAIQEAAINLQAAEDALARADALVADPDAAFRALAEEKGLVFDAGGSLVIPNVAPDEGISAPFNAWMTFFGQFFDHGLDLITKGGNGTVWIPLKPDDPLITHGPDGIANSGDEIPPQLAFMAMTRATPTMGAGADGIMGTADDTQDHINTTTPFVDQNQTYTSHASHQVFLREYKMVFDPVLQTMVPVATGRLLEGQNGGLATWKDVKDQAREMLGIELTDADVLNVPLVYTDPYGQFIRGANGLPQLVTGLNADGTPSGLVSGNLGAPVGTFASGVARIDHAFLDDIAHTAAPIGRQGPLARAEDGIINDANANGVIDAGETPLAPGTYDGDLLDRHFITGDGRGNENFGLTAVHHVFHSEHNRQTIIQKLTILKDGDLAFVNEWLATDISASDLAAIKAGIAAAQAPGSAAPNLYTYLNGLNLNWDGERVFQAARFATEMQYQHLVFEEFGRKIQPAIDPFVFNSVTDINPAIFAEFANVVYRFGHSMLTDEMPRAFYSPDASTNHLSIVDEGLVAAFLDPVAYDLDGTISSEEAAGAVVRGLTNVRGNAIDEFVIDALRNNLLGLPLDLAAINIARGRDTGMPNEARAQLFAATGSSFLKPYANWTEFAIGLKNPLSVVNFIAAYGTHADIVNATTMADKRAVAMELVFGVEADGTTPSDIANRADFINGTGIYAGNKGGLDNVDLWIGGLAEKILLFGGMLGSTFTAIFEAQMENLQDADRFYYLTRTQGLNFLDALEANAFSKMIMANTDLALPGPDGIRGTGDDIIRHHIGIDSFAKYDFILEINQQYQQDYNGAAAGKDPLGNDAVLQGMGLDKVSRMMPGSFDANFYDNYIRFFGGEHVVLGGTSGNDIIFGDLGDDAIWGGAGDDYIEGGQGVDLILGGYGNDIILDEGDEGDFIKGEEGDDVIASSNGLDILMGGDGKDVIFAGADATEVFAGKGNDFVLGGPGADFLLGNEGDDWLEAGGGFDTTAGDNSELFFNSTVIGHDVMFAGSDEHDFDAESGDDIMVQGESVMRNEGMFGFDWSIFKGVERDAYADLRVGIFTTDEQDILRNRFDKVEALSGWKHNDTLIGDDRVAGDILPGAITATTEGIFFNDQLSQAGVDRIDGLRALLGSLVAAAPAGASAAELEAITAFTGGNILLGGAGSDTLRGNAGDDVIDGDAWLNVRIRITNNPGDANTQANQLATVDSLKHIFTAQDAGDPSWVGKSLFELLIARQIVPAQMHIVREILDGGQTGDVDVAVFNDDLFDADGNLNYLITANADGTVRVEHVNVTTAIDPATGRQLLSDGVDILRNIERLRFRDVEIDAPEPNSLPTGAPIIIDPTPTNGLVSPTGGLALSSSIASIQDANGLPTSPAGFAYQWQSSTNNGTTWTDIPGATGPNFTPSNGLNGLGGQVGAILRLRVSYEDADGYDEVVYSAPTMVVGANWNGVPLINNTFNGTAGNDIADGVDPFLGFLGGADTTSSMAMAATTP
jgi:Ca2+-binding RTX toxin-like protein